MSMEFVHRGYLCRYSENGDNWSCMALRFDAETPGKLRAKIDRHDLKLRKEAKVECLEVIGSGRGEPKLLPATIIEYVGTTDIMELRGFTRTVVGKEHRVAAMTKASYGDGQSRSINDLSRFAMDTPQTRQKMARAQGLCAQAKALLKQSEEIVASIPRLKADDIAELIRHFEAASEGEEA